MIKTHPIYYPLYNDKEHFIILITGGRACEDPEQEVIMSDLSTKKLKDVKVGEFLMGDDYTPRKVLYKVEGKSMMYRIRQKNAEDYTATGNHILCLRKTPSTMKPYGELTKKGTPRHPNGRYPQYGEYAEVKVSELLTKSKKFFNTFRGYKTQSIPYEYSDTLIDPYFLGLWLGDGTSIRTEITSPDKEIIDYVYRYAESLGMRVSKRVKNGCGTYLIARKEESGSNRLLDSFNVYGLIKNKHIPQEYISNSESVRLALLAGLLDTDGSLDARGDYEITQKSERLAKEIKYLADTLGFRTTLKEKRGKIGDKDCGIYYRLNISGDIERIPCKVERKKSAGGNYKHRSHLSSSIEIEEAGIGEYCGVILDGNHHYIHKDGTVTHNSGKSYATSSFIERLTFEMSKDEGEKVVHNILFTRYTMTSAGISVIPEFLEKIEADGTERYFKATKTDVVNALTGSRVMFRGIKTSSGNQTAKLKSIHGITTFVVDEAEEWTSEEEFEKIVLSIRQKGLQNRVIIIMNPTDNNHFVYKKYIENSHKIVEYDGVPVQISTHPNVLHIHTSYLDNIGNLSEEFLKEVKSIKDTDPDKYAHTIMGRWADVAEGAVFKNWGIVDKFPDECKKVAIGLDFGYTHDPTAIVKCGIIGNRLYIQELCYKTGMLAGDIIKELRKHDLHVIADSADPRLIDEIALGGVIIYPVQKGPGSILAGIDKMKNMEVFYTKDSLNVQKEQRTYVWAKDKDGNYINQPEDANNHCMDGIRYYVLGKLLGKIMQPKNISKEDTFIY